MSYAKKYCDCEVLIVYSEPEHQGLAHQFGFNLVFSENKPIGRKFNTGLEHALKYNWDYLFQLNSDDLLSNRLFDVFYQAMKNNEPFASIEKLYIYDSETGKVKHYRYTHSGCGIRVVSRAWVEGAGWQKYCRVSRSARGKYIQYSAGEERYLPDGLTRKQFVTPISRCKVFRLWSPERNKGLDNDSRNTMFAVFGEPIGWIKGVNELPMVVDVKSQNNIWQYDDLQGRELDGNERNQMHKQFPELNSVNLVIGCG
jgi:glycosyltransferase involved in cell wall biosynthesis